MLHFIEESPLVNTNDASRVNEIFKLKELVESSIIKRQTRL